MAVADPCHRRLLCRNHKTEEGATGSTADAQLLGNTPWELLGHGQLVASPCKPHHGIDDSTPSSSSQSTCEDDESKCSCKRRSSLIVGSNSSSSNDGLSKHNLVVFYPLGIHGGSDCCLPRQHHRARFTAREKCFGLVAAAAVAGFCTIAVLFLRDRQQTSFLAAQEPDEAQLCLTDSCVETAGTLIKNMDRTADPCNNFFQYSCGGFNKRNIITEDKTSINSIDMLIEDLYGTIKDLLEQTHVPDEWPSVTKTKTVYTSCTNKDLIDRVGDTPLRHLIGDLGGWPVIDDRLVMQSTRHLQHEEHVSISKEELMASVASRLNIPVFLSVSVEVDDQNSSYHVIQIRQPEHLAMMSRDYYIELQHKSLLAAYKGYMIDITELLLNSSTTHDVITDVEDLIRFEMSLAEIMLPESERFEKNVHHVKVTVGDLMRTYPGFDWATYFSKAIHADIGHAEMVSVYDVRYIRSLMKLLKRTHSRTITNYLIWRVIMTYAEELSSTYEFTDFKFKKVLYGFKSPEPRWRKCLKYISRQMDMVVGSMLAQSKFGKDSLLTANELIDHLRESFHEMLANATWMDEETREHAHIKANAMSEKIGYPEYIMNAKFVDQYHQELVVSKDDYFLNLLNLEKFHFSKKARRLREPVDATMWKQPITEVNAFYDPHGNEMVFPAGIWQPPFFSSKYPRSMIYGGIGVVIGHEITHGFDSKGRLHDKEGNIREWWTNKTNDAFAERSKCMEEQYSSIVVEQVSMPVDGKITLSENIADNGGVKEAFMAYQKWVNRHGAEKRLPGLNLSGEQLFFVNYAQIWCGNTRNEQLILDLKISEHSPGPVRTQLPLANLDAFADAFRCPLGSQMNPANKCIVW